MTNWRRIVITILTLASLSQWFAALNGYPLFMIGDSMEHLQNQTFLKDSGYRPSSMYGVFTLISSLGNLSLWLVGIIQSSLIIGTLLLVFRRYFPEGSLREFFCITAIVTLLSSFPLFAGRVHPDLLCSLLPLLVLIGLTSSSRLELGCLLLSYMLCSMMNSSFALIGVIAPVPLLAMRKWLPHLRAKRLLAFSSAAAAGLLLILLKGILVTGKPFPYTTRSLSIGPLVEYRLVDRYLEDHCPDPAISLCELKGTLELDPDRFYWNDERTRVIVVPRQISNARLEEYGRITREIYRLYPLEVTKVLFRSFIRALFSVHEDGSLNKNSLPRKFISTKIPHEIEEFSSSIQVQDDKTLSIFTRRLLRIQTILLISMLLGGLLLASENSSMPSSYMVRNRRERVLPIFVVCASFYLTNIAVCIALSRVIDRYQLRMVWVFLWILAIWVWRIASESIAGRQLAPHHGNGIDASKSGRAPFVFPLIMIVLVTNAANLLRGIVVIPDLDDSFVVLVYARNFLQSGAFFYNAAEGHLNGFTSFLDVLFKAGLLAVAPASALQGSVVFAVCEYLMWVVLSVIVVTSMLRSRGHVGVRELVVASAACVALTLNRGVAQGTMFLLETPMVAFLMTATAAVIIRGSITESRWCRWTLGALLPLLILARPEMTVLILCIACVLRYQDGDKLRHWGIVPHLGILFVTIYYISHDYYFGYPFPNSYYAKTSSLRSNEILDGLGYLAQSARQLDSLCLYLSLALSPIAANARFWSSRGARNGFVTVVTIAGVALIITVYSGGDCYIGERLLTVPTVMIPIALLVASRYGLPKLQRVCIKAIVAIAVLRLLYLAAEIPINFGGTSVARYGRLDRDYACAREGVQKIEAALSEHTVAVSNAQFYKWFAPNTVVFDLDGLNSGRVAHRKVNSKVAYGKYTLADVLAYNADVTLGHSNPKVQRASLGSYGWSDMFENENAWRLLFLSKPPDKTLKEISRNYLPASMPVCKKLHFNFLVSRKRAADLLAGGGNVLIPAGE